MSLMTVSNESTNSADRAQIFVLLVEVSHGQQQLVMPARRSSECESRGSCWLETRLWHG